MTIWAVIVAAYWLLISLNIIFRLFSSAEDGGFKTSMSGFFAVMFHLLIGFSITQLAK